MNQYLKTPRKRTYKERIANIQFGDFLLDELPERPPLTSEDELVELPRKKRKLINTKPQEEKSFTDNIEKY